MYNANIFPLANHWVAIYNGGLSRHPGPSMMGIYHWTVCILRVWIFYTAPVPTYTIPVIGTGTYHTCFVTVCYETCGLLYTCGFPTIPPSIQPHKTHTHINWHASRSCEVIMAVGGALCAYRACRTYRRSIPPTLVRVPPTLIHILCCPPSLMLAPPLPLFVCLFSFIPSHSHSFLLA